MIYIEWFQIDYLTVLPIFLLIILGIIILLRIIRRLTRWGPVEVSHIRIEQTHIENIELEIYKPIQPNEATKTIIFVPPLSLFKPRRNHIATALALYNFNVILLTPQFISQLDKNYQRTMIWNQLIDHFSPILGITFDYAMPSIIRSVKFDSKPLFWIFSRPLLSRDHIQSIFLLFPFTPKWFSRILYQIKKVKSDISDPKQELDEWSLPETMQFALIHPESTWLNQTGKKALQLFSQNNKAKMVEEIHFTSGGWSFYFQETIWFGHIIHIIRSFLNNM
jgi:hypothetical protein